VLRRRCWAAGLVAAIAGAGPAAAQQAVGSGPALLTLPPHPTDTGKPVIYDPQLAAKSDQHSECAPGFSCRWRLLGVIQNNGAVELKATIFNW